MILSSTKENDLVLDMFCGSGTSGVAAKKHNRNYIGIENNKEFYNIAKKRIKDLC